MDIEQALHYAEIILAKLEQAERRIGGARIHDSKVHRAIIMGYKKMLEDKQNGNAYPLSITSILSSLNDGLEAAEKFLARSV